MIENELATIVIAHSVEIHKAIGPGMLEKVYVECLSHRLIKLGLKVQKERPIPVYFEEIRMECGYRADLIISDKLIVEVKSVEAIADIHIAQALTYLKFAGCKLALIINFNVPILKNGIRRVVHQL